MRNLILSMFGLLAALVLYFGVNTNFAEAGCKREATGACVASQRAATAPAVLGRKAPTTSPMACLRILVDPSLTAIVLVKGRGVNGTVLSSIRASSGKTIMDKSRGFAVKEFCFKRGLIAGLGAITVCNGHKPGDGNHHVLEGRWLASLQRTGHAGDYLSLLGTRRTRSGDILRTYDEGLYRSQYGS